MNKNFTTLTVHKKVSEMLEFLAKAQGKSKSKTFEDILSPLFQVGINFPERANIEDNISILNHVVTFTFSGKSTLTCGVMKEEDLEKLRDRMMSQTKEDIKKVRKNERK